MDPRIRDIAERLKENPRTPLTDLTHVAGLSPSRLQHLFLLHQRMSIRQYSQRLVLLRAACLLVTSDMSIKEIRFVVGLSDPSAFCRAFRKRFGVAPDQFRRIGRVANQVAAQMEAGL